MATRHRIVIATTLAVAAMALIAWAWLGDPAWKKLLLFAGMVGVAAWGWGRETQAAVRKPAVDSTSNDPVIEHAPVSHEQRPDRLIQ
ncbi:MAG: hypothetical protein JWL98_1648 [Xanthomonadaceae bacterium]|nr:hypothetical protein [Xanthomonadaceae bacterium]